MGIQKLLPDGIDFAKYKPLTKRPLVLCRVKNTWYKALDIQGKGFLTTAAVTTRAQDPVQKALRVTIDNAVVYNGYIDNSSVIGKTALGIFFFDYSDDGFELEGSYDLTAMGEYPYTAGEEYSVIINVPIFFSNRLLVEVMSKNTDNVDILTIVRGGVI